MLAQRGIEASYETIRCWTLKFGQSFAQNLRQSRDKPTGHSHTLNRAAFRMGQFLPHNILDAVEGAQRRRYGVAPSCASKTQALMRRGNLRFRFLRSVYVVQNLTKIKALLLVATEPLSPNKSRPLMQDNPALKLIDVFGSQ
jgi:hypothetical protein